MAKKKSTPRKKATKKASQKPQFSHKDIVTFDFHGREVDGIVMSYDGEFYYVRLIGDYHDLYPSVLISCVGDQLTLAQTTINWERDQNIINNPAQLRRMYNRIAAQRLKGRTIANARYLTPEDCEAMDWRESGLCLILDDGTEITLMRDDEGNGPGALSGFTPDTDDEDPLGEQFTIPTCPL